MNVMHDPAFRIYALCAVVLVMKMLLVGLWTSVVRGRLQAALNPEDAGAAAAREAEHPEVARLLRVWLQHAAVSSTGWKGLGHTQSRLCSWALRRCTSIPRAS